MATSRSKKGDLDGAARGLVQWPKISPPLIKLHVDLENPRHEPMNSEAEAIAWLYENEKVEPLAKDIAEHRALSPLESIGVIAMTGNPGHFTAVEGNRRLCALILLNDPERAPSQTTKVLFRKLSKQVTIPAKIEVVQFNSRTDSKHWTDLRHLGPQDGQGVVTWSATQKDRAAGGGANALAVAILDRARDGKWLDDKTPPPVTTLTRYLSNRELRAALGLGQPRQLVFTHAQHEVDAALRQFLLDARPSSDGSQARVHSRSNDVDRAAYAREFRTRGFTPQTELTAPQAPTPAAPGASAKTGSRNRPHPDKRKYLISTGFVCKAEDKNLRALFKEMQQTPIDEHEFANTYLLRAFVERVMVLYMKKVAKGESWKEGQDLVKRCADKLDPTQSANKFKVMRVAASNKDASHSLHTLGAAVHTNLLHDRKALVTAWGNWEFPVTQMLEVISKS